MDLLITGKIFSLILLSIATILFIFRFILKMILLSYPDIILGHISTLKMFFKDNSLFQTSDMVEDKLNLITDTILGKFFNRPIFIFFFSGLFIYSLSFVIDLSGLIQGIIFIMFIFIKPSIFKGALNVSKN